MIYLDDSKTGISVEKYLLNKEVFCIKTVSDVDLGAILSAYSTILITGVECEEVRTDCHYIGISFKDFTGESKEIKIYIDGGEYALSAFVKTTFYPIHQTIKRSIIDEEKYISCALFLKGYLNPFPAKSTTDWNEIHYIANSIKRHIEGKNYIPINKDWADKGSVLDQLHLSAKERGEENI